MRLMQQPFMPKPIGSNARPNPTPIQADQARTTGKTDVLTLSGPAKTAGGVKFGGWYDRYMSPENVAAHLQSGHYSANEVDDYGDTPLTIAAGCGNQEVCELLLDAGAKINHKGYEGNTALSNAAA